MLPLSSLGTRPSGLRFAAGAWSYFTSSRSHASPSRHVLSRPFPRGELGWKRSGSCPQAQLGSGRAGVCPRPLGTPHCPRQDVLSPAFPHPRPLLPVPPQSGPTVQASFEQSLPRTGSFLSLSLNSSSELPSQASPERLPEHLRCVSYAFPTPSFFPVDGLPDCRGPGPSHHPTLFRKTSSALSSSQTTFSHTLYNNPTQFLFIF